MIVFRGILNKKNMKSQAAKAKRIAAVSVALVAVALILIVMLLYATGEAPVEEVKDICASAITAFLISIVLFFVPIPDRRFLNQCHITVEIEPDWLRCDRPYHGAPYVTMPVKDVKGYWTTGNAIISSIRIWGRRSFARKICCARERLKNLKRFLQVK